METLAVQNNPLCTPGFQIIWKLLIDLDGIGQFTYFSVENRIYFLRNTVQRFILLISYKNKQIRHNFFFFSNQTQLIGPVHRTTESLRIIKSQIIEKFIDVMIWFSSQFLYNIHTHNMVYVYCQHLLTIMKFIPVFHKIQTRSPFNTQLNA